MRDLPCRNSVQRLPYFRAGPGGNPRDTRELARLNLVIDLRDFGTGSALLRIRSHNFFEMPVSLARELALAW